MTVYEKVERPSVRTAGRNHGRNGAILKTLQSGKAIAVAINGETYAIARNRIAASAAKVAAGAKAKFCTQKSEDGLAVLVWLEQKSTASAA